MTEPVTNSGANSPAASAPSSSNSPGQSSAAPNNAAPNAGSGQPSQPSQPQNNRPAWAVDSQWSNNTLVLDKVGEELNGLRAFKSEQEVRRNTLPKAETDYQTKLPGNFQLPAGVTFEFDANSPELAAARKIAHARGIDQDTFSDFLGVYAAGKIAEQTNQAKAREANLQQLGPAGPQRIDAVATWLQARAGDAGKQVADFIRKYPSAPIVATMESLIKQFSSQGGADFSQSHRAEEDQAGKIPGYENMNFVQRRVHQMARQLQAQPPAGGGRR